MKDHQHFNKIYQPDWFRACADVVISRLEHYLKDQSIRGLLWREPEQLMEEVNNLTAQLPTPSHDIHESTLLKKIVQMVDLYIKTGVQVHSQGYMGRQFSGVIPLAGIFEVVGSLVNQPASIYEVSQLPSVVEKLMTKELLPFIGWNANQSTMIMTHGGSLANLTALLTARNIAYPDCWQKGLFAFTNKWKPGIAVSQDVHYSMNKAAGVLGIGVDQIIPLPIDKQRRICPDRTANCIEKAEKKGIKIFAMVATAGTTPIGAFDPINDLSKIAHKKDIWLHVDGAHGASFLLSSELRHKLNGIEQADSLTWDAHKLMGIPPLCTFLFYKDKQHSFETFHQGDTYIFNCEENPLLTYDGAFRSLECTKRPSIMSVWALWSIYGPELFSSLMNRFHEQSIAMYHLLNEQEDFFPLHKPECNMVCFQYQPTDIAPYKISLFNKSIREKLLRNGHYYISSIDLDGQTLLRVVFTNPCITIDTCKQLLDEIRTYKP